MIKTKEIISLLADVIESGEKVISAAKEMIHCAELFFDAMSQFKNSLSAEIPELPSPTYTKEDVRMILSEKAASGYATEVKELLLRHGAANLSTLNEESYAAVIAEAEVIGND